MSGRADRASKKQRRLSTDSEGTEEGYDWAGLKGGPSKAGKATEKSKNKPSRPSRKAAETSSAVVSRAPPGSSTRGLSLTVKTSANKLREATRSSPLNQSVTVNSRESFTGGEIIEGKRSRNVRKSYVLESDSDEDEEMEDVNDQDAEGDSLEDDEDMDVEDDGLGDDDADGDVDMDVAPPPPTIKISKAQSGKQTITAKPSSKPDNKTVEQKEVELGSDDEELSELESDLEEEVEEEGMQTGNEEDAEGEEEEIEIEEEAEEEDELDSDLETPGGGSRASTPDLNKLTKRQRARLEEGGSGHLLALPDGPSKEAPDGRRARYAPCRNGSPKKELEREAQRGRKGMHTSAVHILNTTNLSQMETINKLLKKQAPKTNARRKDLNGEFSPDGDVQKPRPQFVRWVSNKDGNRIGVPEEWLEAPIGSMFQNSVKGAGMGGKLIEEVS
ncbi:hypothetical protein LSUB1_G003770 [Lachnellula subtilissima]|uniref:INO80 complex subunit B-like conserved region domain-containing protein n=1 Tax=Lachnellula subtilissima TaxID=602034 RepID=A0A8H8RTA2_9HELO|nr:hypothetical protein LSUB1_G003770 [Lachnellula subtilissima]